jgi:hypothetical protein
MVLEALEPISRTICSCSIPENKRKNVLQSGITHLNASTTLHGTTPIKITELSEDVTRVLARLFVSKSSNRLSANLETGARMLFTKEFLLSVSFI